MTCVDKITSFRYVCTHVDVRKNYILYLLFQKSMDEIGCTTPFVVNLDHICKDLKTSIKAKKLYDRLHHKTHKIKDCLYPCKFIKIAVTPYKKRSDKNTTRLKFDKFIKVTKATYSYTELELLAEFGGYVGLFLGFSVFQVSQVVDKILDKLMKKY